jgi:site-specific recombinase XerD
MQLPLSPKLKFSEAAEKYLEARTFGRIHSKVRYCAPNTLRSYRANLNALVLFFASLSLEEIHLGHVEQYRLQRSEKAGPTKIIQEENILKSILRRAGCWTPEMEEQYVPIQKIESDIPQALTPDQQAHWLQVASSKERWQVVHLYSIVAFRTTASNCEMRGIRLQDINQYQQVLLIQAKHAKNKFRIRTIPLPPDALWALERLTERANSCGSRLPHHFLFPFRACKGIWLPDRPMTEWGIRKLWDEVREASKLAWFTFHDCRHTAITRYAEAGVPIQTLMSMAGHINQKMQLHYTWISEQAKRRAVMAVYEGKLYEADLRRPVNNAPSHRQHA